MKIPIFKHNTEMVTDGNIYQDIARRTFPKFYRKTSNTFY